jgi:hypothetical protein
MDVPSIMSAKSAGLMINCRDPVRTGVTVVAIAGLFYGFVQAPFLHVHAEESDHPGASGAHWHGLRFARGTGLQIGAQTGDDDEIEIAWHATPPLHVTFTVDFAVSPAVIVKPPETTLAAVPVPRPRGHDPPDLPPQQPRSPPV